MPAMVGPSARTGRRPESAEARNRGVLGAAVAATSQQAYGDLKRTPVAADAQSINVAG